MKNFFKKGISFALAFTLVVTMCFGSIGTAKAYAADTAGTTEPVALSVYDGDELVKEYTLDDLKAIAKAEGDIEYKFSGYNRNPSFYTFGDPDNKDTPSKNEVKRVIGPTVAGILTDAGVTYTDDQLLTFAGADGVAESFIAGDLFQERYYFPKGKIAIPYEGTPAQEENYADAEPVVPVIDLHRRTDDPATEKNEDKHESVLRFGQTAPNEQNNAAFVKFVADGGSIIVGDCQDEQWESISETNYNSGVILPETEIKPVIPESLQLMGSPYTKKVSVYYTVDGSEPGHGDSIFNYSKDMNCSKYMDINYNGEYINAPVFEKEGTYTVKFKVIGYGKLDSETTTFTYEVKDVEAPSVPADFAAIATGKGEAALTWVPSEDADGYEILRQNPETGKYDIYDEIGKPSGNYYGDTSIKEGQEYSYKVRAYKLLSGGQKVYSSNSKALTVLIPEMAARELKAASAGYNSVKLSWNKAKGVAGYEIYRSDDESEPFELIKTIDNNETLSFTDTGLITGKTYSYEIRAFLKFSEEVIVPGEYSAAVSVKPVLGKTTLTGAARSGYSSVKLTWNKVTGATGYEVYRYNTSKKTFELAKTVTSGSTLTVTDTGLTTGKTYRYNVKAFRVNSDGTKVYGAESNEKSATPVLAKASLKSVARAGYSSIQVKWSKVSGAAGYHIYRYDSKTKKWKYIKNIKSGSTVSYTNTGLKTGTKYTYKVRAYRGSSYGSFSSTKSATPTLSKPVMKTLKAGSKSITVRWNKVSGAYGYKIYRSTKKSSGYKLVKTITKGSTVSWKNTGLKKGTRYYYKVKAYRTVDKKKVYSSYSSSKYIKSK